MQILDAKQLKKDIISDMRVELSEEFDRNFQRKAFFTKRWKPRKVEGRGTLLLVTGTMRRSIQPSETDTGVRFSSNVPYATIHNEGGTGYKQVRQHTRRTRGGKTTTVRAHQRRFNMPQRQFVGDSPETQRIIRTCIEENLTKVNLQLVQFLKQHTK